MFGDYMLVIKVVEASYSVNDIETSDDIKPICVCVYVCVCVCVIQKTDLYKHTHTHTHTQVKKVNTT